MSSPTSGRSKSNRTTKASPQAGRGSRSRRLVHSFSEEGADGNKDMKDLLGGKGANLAEMCNLGLPVPPGFTISTEVCTWATEHGGMFPEQLTGQVEQALARVEREMGKRFGDPSDPLLVSVRSGARVSMPGMMDTVLNLGLNEETCEGLAAATGNARFAWDAYRRFVQMYSDVVLEVRAREGEHESPFAAALERKKAERGVTEDTELDEADLRALVAEFKRIVKRRSGHEFPEEPEAQLWGAIAAVFRSWNNERAVVYREMNDIPSDWGTAVSVVAMVYGNLGEDSGTGVAFTRDPATGEKRFYGEYLMNAQGEDVVAGIRTPNSIESLEQSAPRAWKELLRIQKKLERHYRDMQDLEFTIERGKLYMLQCRSGKRTGFAAVRIAVEMVAERLITREEALARVEPASLEQLLAPVFAPARLAAAKREGRLLTSGLNAGPGAASGHIAFSSTEAMRRAKKGQAVVLTRIETSPEDIRGMEASRGILTARGGMTSHAALVARQMGKVCVAGAGEVEIDYRKGTLRVGQTVLREGDWLSIDGTSGDVYAGELETQPSTVLQALFGRGKKAKESPVFAAYQKLMSWADDARRLAVRTNADQPDQCRTAVAFGAEGIGLCRTEHMFFGEGKIEAVQRMILAENPEQRREALAELLPLQRKDFEGIFRSMGSRPVTIRTLDPPLHEFLPHTEEAVKRVAADLGVPVKQVRASVEALEETNPMLGHRGCRLGITHPEITAMQARAIFEAACNVAKRGSEQPRVEIMIPLVGAVRELELQADVVHAEAEDVFDRKGLRVPYLVGTMIELPRAALTAAEIADVAEFFSFGTNDLTQTTFGISRDDSAKFIPDYVSSDVLPHDPFERLDRAGVGRLVSIASTEGRATRPDIKLGICGEHGGEPSSIAFFHEQGLDYVSCSPFRLPIARLAAAQAALADDAD
jgi:pyruvate,orthophosphate dikinase